jgi:hypothetical protein
MPFLCRSGAGRVRGWALWGGRGLHARRPGRLTLAPRPGPAPPGRQRGMGATLRSIVTAVGGVGGRRRGPSHQPVGIVSGEHRARSPRQAPPRHRQVVWPSRHPPIPASAGRRGLPDVRGVSRHVPIPDEGDVSRSPSSATYAPRSAASGAPKVEVAAPGTCGALGPATSRVFALGRGAAIAPQPRPPCQEARLRRAVDRADRRDRPDRQDLLPAGGDVPGFGTAQGSARGRRHQAAPASGSGTGRRLEQSWQGRRPRGQGGAPPARRPTASSSAQPAGAAAEHRTHLRSCRAPPTCSNPVRCLQWPTSPAGGSSTTSCPTSPRRLRQPADERPCRLPSVDGWRRAPLAAAGQDEGWDVRPLSAARARMDSRGRATVAAHTDGQGPGRGVRVVATRRLGSMRVRVIVARVGGTALAVVGVWALVGPGTNGRALLRRGGDRVARRARYLAAAGGCQLPGTGRRPDPAASGAVLADHPVEKLRGPHEPAAHSRDGRGPHRPVHGDVATRRAGPPSKRLYRCRASKRRVVPPRGAAARRHPAFGRRAPTPPLLLGCWALPRAPAGRSGHRRRCAPS